MPSPPQPTSNKVQQHLWQQELQVRQVTQIPQERQEIRANPRVSERMRRRYGEEYWTAELREALATNDGK